MSAMASSEGVNASPMSELNTTPLIDVMLVLLVMFIITIPVATHSVDMDLPQPCVGEQCPEITFNEVKNKLVLDAQDRLLWNSSPVSEEQLASVLHQTTLMQTEPELQFEPVSTASYEASLRALNQIEASGVTKFGFVGNERYARFDAGR